MAPVTPAKAPVAPAKAPVAPAKAQAPHLTKVAAAAHGSSTAPRRALERCAYIRCCYLADALNCFGYKADCHLYQKSNGIELKPHDFDAAMDELIDKVRARTQNLAK